MASTVHGFDGWLTAVLAEEAATAGETVDVFIARAVTARMAVELARRGDPGLEEMLRRIREMDDLQLPAPAPHPGGGSVIADPDRLHALYDTGLLDTERGRALDRIVEMTVAALAVPSAAVSLVDRDDIYLPSAIGMPAELALARQVPLAESISRPIVSTGTQLITPDARTHAALRNHPMVRNGYLVAYAGFPITDSRGHTIGALSVWDSKPRPWSAGHMRILEDFTALVCTEVFGETAEAAEPA